MAEAQILNTEKYGKIRVIMSFHEGPRVIHLLENGSYCFEDGRGVDDVQQLRNAIPTPYIEKALFWFEHRDDRVMGKVRKIEILPNNTLVYADTQTPVDAIDDVLAYFDPGPFREAALIAFANRLQALKSGKAPSWKQVTGSDQKAAQVTESPPAPKKPQTSIEKARAAKAKKAAAKKAAAPAPPE
jgi:hypothetical protein